MRRKDEKWVLVSVEVPEQAVDAVANFLHELGAPGLVTGIVEHAENRSPAAAGPQATRRRSATNPEPRRLEAYFSAGAAGTALDALARYLASLSAVVPGIDPAAVRSQPLEPAQWETDWRTHFRPIEIGTRLLVAPPWDVPPAGARIALVIEPGMAFGTGVHGSTRGCLEAIESVLAAEPLLPRALDVGTGSGILAVAMARLGVERVVAIDTDPAVLPVAATNARRNGAGAAIVLAAVRPGALRTSFPLVVANLLLGTLRAEAAALVERTSPGGILIASGVSVEQVRELKQALGRRTRPVGQWVCEGWATVAFRR